MKALFAALVMIFATNAFASSLPPKEEFIFKSVRIASEFTELTSVVSLDRYYYTMTVRLFDDRCDSLLPASPGTIRCRAAAILVSEFTVNMKAMKTSCGTYIYEGERDLSRVGRGIIQISLVDYRQTTCEVYHNEPMWAAIKTYGSDGKYYSLTNPVF